MNRPLFLGGLTIDPAGISKPEVALGVTTRFRGLSGVSQSPTGSSGERDIAVGKVVGSNTFNTLDCLGLSALVSDGLRWVGRVGRGAGLPACQAAGNHDRPEFARGNGGVFLENSGARHQGLQPELLPDQSTFCAALPLPALCTRFKSAARIKPNFGKRSMR